MILGNARIIGAIMGNVSILLVFHVPFGGGGKLTLNTQHLHNLRCCNFMKLFKQFEISHHQHHQCCYFMKLLELYETSQYHHHHHQCCEFKKLFTTTNTTTIIIFITTTIFSKFNPYKGNSGLFQVHLYLFTMKPYV